MAPASSSPALHEKTNDQSEEKVDEKGNKNKGKAEEKTSEENEKPFREMSEAERKRADSLYLSPYPS